MHVMTKRPGMHFLLATFILPVSAAIAAQPEPSKPDIDVVGTPAAETVAPVPGADVKGVITARSSNRIQVTGADGTPTIIAFNDETRIKAGGGLFGGGRNNLTAASLLNGLPVTVKTLQTEGGLLASQITFKNNDLKTATMIRNGTAQGFAEQTAATEALRGRMGDIDKYNVKSTTNVYFDTGKAVLSPQAKADLCNAANQAEGVDNALMLVVGYTDSVGDDDFNQVLSERRAASAINYLQQVCHWKPYRMLTPTGMAKADPLASNDTEEGKAQNRRVSVNVLVSKGLDGI